MAKKNCKKSNQVGNEKKLNENVQELMEMGNNFGQSIIGLMAQFATNWKGIGIAAVGLAKALAALKAVARESDVEIESLYKKELAYFEDEYFSILSEEADTSEN